MAKKKIDLWGDVNTYKANEVSHSSDTSLSLGKKTKKKDTPIIGSTNSAVESDMTQAEKVHARNNRKLNNPLTVVEGKSEVVTDVSTAVSAALSKAIQDDYEVERLSEILDVVIDEVDDPDLSNESLRRKNFGIIPFFLVIGSIVLAIILIPLVLMLGFSIGKVSDLKSAREIMGYKTDINGDGSETHFSIQHIETGKYLSPPVNEAGNIIYNAPLTLTDVSPFDANGDLINDLYFHASNSDGSEIQINFDEYSIINDNGQVKWMETFEAQSGIYLVKSNTGEQKFSIGFENTNKFLAYDNKSEQLELSNNPDYFKLEAEVSFITDKDSYLSDYDYLYSGTDGYVSNLDLGINGNALSLFSTTTHQYLNSYKTVNYKDLPFVEISNDEYSNVLTTSNENEYNFFLNPVDTAVEHSLSLGSFQTTQFDWTQIPFSTGGDTEPEEKGSLRELKQSTKTQYPLLTAQGNTLSFVQYDNSYQKGETMDDGTIINQTLTKYPATTIYLLPDPTNLKNKAIFFVEAKAFLSTEGGVHLQRITKESQIKDLDFFTFSFSSKRNPENIYSTVDSLTETTGNFTLYANNYSSVKGWELFLEGYSSETVYRLKQDIAKIFNNASLSADEKQEQIKEKFIESRDDYKHEKSATKNNVTAYELNHLEFDTWYIGFANVYRDQNKNVGKHSTSIPVIFKTADASGKVHNWGDGETIDITEPETGNPTSNGTTDTPAVVTELIETTATENPGSLNNVGGGDESTNDLLADDMREMGSTSLEVTTTLTNGSITNAKSGVVTGIRVTLYDSSDDVVDTQEVTTTDKIWGLESGDYTFLFTGLKPQETYTAQIEVSDIKDEWFIPQQTENNSEAQLPLEMDTERLLPPVIDNEIKTYYDDRGIGIATPITELQNLNDKTDTLNFKFTSTADGRRFETGFKQLSSYTSTSGVTAGGELTVKLQEYALAGGYGLSIGGDSTIVGNDYTFEVILQMGPLDFDDWSDDSPLWYNGNGGQIKLFSGTVSHQG